MAVRWNGRCFDFALLACALAGTLMSACRPPLIPDATGVLGEPPCAIAPETPMGGRLLFTLPVIVHSAPLHVTFRLEGTKNRLIGSKQIDITKKGRLQLRLPLDIPVGEGTVITYRVIWKGDEVIRDTCLFTATGVR
jgi:hypothetical protein